ncbi:MAG: hypothetical protein C5B51_01125 [Terriglobia bacterium]|nr:MAG: hypothetical protein C5B51_01125 [Terriglobia bacterium]
MLKQSAMGLPIERTFSVKLNAHYLLRTPHAHTPQMPLIVAVHGFGSNSETMLELTQKLFDFPVVIAAIQGPNQFFLGADTGQVGYGWITSKRPDESIRLHRDMILHVLQDAGNEFGIPAERCILVGFSQGVALNYRFAATCPNAVRGVVGICGGVPSDWQDPQYRPVTAALLHIARRGDQYYPPNMTEHYPDRLRLRASDVEFHLIDGGHTIPSAGNRIVGPWVTRILAPSKS